MHSPAICLARTSHAPRMHLTCTSQEEEEAVPEEIEEILAQLLSGLRDADTVVRRRTMSQRWLVIFELARRDAGGAALGTGGSLVGSRGCEVAETWRGAARWLRREAPSVARAVWLRVGGFKVGGCGGICGSCLASTAPSAGEGTARAPATPPGGAQGGACRTAPAARCSQVGPPPKASVGSPADCRLSLRTMWWAACSSCSTRRRRPTRGTAAASLSLSYPAVDCCCHSDCQRCTTP